MNRNVFEIDGLQCAYVHRGKGERKVVLSIESLSIPMGKVTMILGLSGSGKSTLIETLGLMNNTIEKGAVSYFSGEAKVKIGSELWKCPAELTKIRNRHFSFIFQNDFLMPYFSPEDNMMIGMLIHESYKMTSDPTVELKEICQRLGLNFDAINGKKPFELSVGQRQRLSFIRAISKDYSVIFGDEPTGNLDNVNSELLMDVLIESIQQNPKRSAILVSHNIPLSVAKADYIIVLSKQNAELYEIKLSSIFSRSAKGWSDATNMILSNELLTSKIREIVSADELNQGSP